MERFEIEKKIGAGAQATAYLAHLVKDVEQQFVLKRLPVQSVSVSEMGILYKLVHPAVVRCHDAFTHDGDLFLVLQYADGGDLERVISSAERRHAAPREVLPMPVVDRIFIQLCLGLQFCHEQRTLHRDLKTANVFLNKDNTRALLGDFGVAKELAADSSVANTMVGTPMTFAPETVSGEGYTYASDVWALGCILYEMLTFKKPFPYSNLGTLVQKVSQGEFDPLPSSTPGHYRRIIKGMLQVDVHKRYSIQEALGEMSRKLVVQVQQDLKAIDSLPDRGAPSASSPKAPEAKMKQQHQRQGSDSNAAGAGATPPGAAGSDRQQAQNNNARRGRRDSSPRGHAAQAAAAAGQPPSGQPPSGRKAAPAARALMPTVTGGSSEAALSTGPLKDWVKWKHREFEEIDSYLRMFTDDDGGGVTPPPQQQQQQGGGRRRLDEDQDGSPGVPAPPRTPPGQGELNANRARRMLPSPQVMKAVGGGGGGNNGSAPSAVGGGPASDRVGVRPLRQPELHDDPVAEAAAARKERDAKRDAERQELKKAMQAGRKGAAKDGAAIVVAEPDARPPRHNNARPSNGNNANSSPSVVGGGEFPAGGGHNLVRHLSPAPSQERREDAGGASPAGASPAGGDGAKAGGDKKKAAGAAARDRPSLKEVREQQRKAAAAAGGGGGNGGNFDVEIVLPGNLQHLLPGEKKGGAAR